MIAELSYRSGIHMILDVLLFLPKSLSRNRSLMSKTIRLFSPTTSVSVRGGDRG